MDDVASPSYTLPVLLRDLKSNKSTEKITGEAFVEKIAERTALPQLAGEANLQIADIRAICRASEDKSEFGLEYLKAAPALFLRLEREMNQLGENASDVQYIQFSALGAEFMSMIFNPAFRTEFEGKLRSGDSIEPHSFKHSHVRDLADFTADLIDRLAAYADITVAGKMKTLSRLLAEQI